MQFCGKRTITLNYAMFININGSCQCLLIKTFMSDFSSVYCSILSEMVCTFFDDFCKNSIRISFQIIFVNKHWPQSCPSPFKLYTIILDHGPLLGPYVTCSDMSKLACPQLDHITITMFLESIFEEDGTKWVDFYYVPFWVL